MLLKPSSTPASQAALGIDPSTILEMGQGDRTVLFLHGLFGTPEHWRSVMERLADQYRVIAPQLPVDPQPGRRQHGINAIADLSDQVADLVESLQIDPFVICGNSLGGLVAIDLCVHRPDFAQGLGLGRQRGSVRAKPDRRDAAQGIA